MAGLLSKLVVKAVDATKKTPTELKLLSRRELRSVLKLFYQEGWIDFKLSDLEFMFQISPKTCFKFVANDQMVGVTFALLLDNGVCYPNSSIIVEKHRKKVKYHSEVLKYADYLKQIAKFEVMYSAKWLVDLYKDGMGYKAIADIHRFKIHHQQKNQKLENQQQDQHLIFEQLNEENLPEIASYLEKIYQSERASLLSHAIKNNYFSLVSRDNENHINGFSMIRDLPKYDQIGPVIAQQPNIAINLITTLIQRHQTIDNSRNLMMDGDKNQLAKCLNMANINFEKEGTEMVKMIRGDESLREDDQSLFAIYSHYLS